MITRFIFTKNLLTLNLCYVESKMNDLFQYIMRCPGWVHCVPRRHGAARRLHRQLQAVPGGADRGRGPAPARDMARAGAQGGDLQGLQSLG